MELDDETHGKIEALSEEGNELLEDGDWRGAVVKWRLALDLLPEPKSDWDAATWLYASIGDAQYQGGDFTQAKESLYDALNCPEGQQNPFVHLRLGQTLHVLREDQKSLDHLLQAYMLDGEDIFLLEDGGEVDLQRLRDKKLIP